MSDEGEDIYYECVVCEGRMRRGRNGDNGSRCKHDSCKGVRKQTASPQDNRTLPGSAGILEPMLPRATAMHQCLQIKEA